MATVKRHMAADRWIGMGLAVLGLAAIGASMSIPIDSDGSWGARIFPLFAAVALIIIGVIEALKTRPVRIQAEQAESFLKVQIPQILTLLLLALVYFWLIGKFGYLISTGIAAVLALMLFGVRNPIGLAAAAVLCPLVYHLLFFVLLGVYPPFGEWFDLLDIIEGN